MLNFESSMKLFIILRSRMSELCFKTINKTSGYRMNWKEKGLDMKVPILLDERKESHSGLS